MNTEVNLDRSKLRAEKTDEFPVFSSGQSPSVPALPPWCPCRECPWSPLRHHGSEAEPIAAVAVPVLR